MKAANTIILILVGLILGYLIRMYVHPRGDEKPDAPFKSPFQTVTVKSAQVETRSFSPDSTDPTRAILITGDFLNALTHLRDSIDSYGVRVYFASDNADSSTYDKFIVVGTNKEGKDLIKLAEGVQKGQILAQGVEDERESTEASELKKSGNYDIRTCPKMCDAESPLMPETDSK